MDFFVQKAVGRQLSPHRWDRETENEASLILKLIFTVYISIF